MDRALFTVILVAFGLPICFILADAIPAYYENPVFCGSDTIQHLAVVSQRMPLQGIANSPEPFAEITLHNFTGGEILEMDCTGFGAFAQGVQGCPASGVPQDGLFTLQLFPAGQGSYPKSQVMLVFTDFFGTERIINVFCEGEIYLESHVQ